MSPLRIVVTCGDPGGIGPEVTVRSLAQVAPGSDAEFIVIGDAQQLEALAVRLRQPKPKIATSIDAKLVPVGRPSREGGVAAASAVKAAVAMLESGHAQALVTGPVSKAALHLAGYSWQGQTEMLGEFCGVRDLRVMLVAGDLRVVHVSAHRSLTQAIEMVTSEHVFRTIALADDFGRRLLGRTPAIAVLGLNPHAGEGGLLGREDEERIRPAVVRAAEQGVNAVGPLSPDSLFPQMLDGAFDIAIAMYHDQGHIPVKLLARGSAVAITLGLPFLRTSPDHGSAFELVGTDRADPRSMRAALQLAAEASAKDISHLRPLPQPPPQ